MQLTTREVELSVDRAVDDASLEAVVGVTERYRGGHNRSERASRSLWVGEADQS